MLSNSFCQEAAEIVARSEKFGQDFQDLQDLQDVVLRRFCEIAERLHDRLVQKKISRVLPDNATCRT